MVIFGDNSENKTNHCKSQNIKIKSRKSLDNKVVHMKMKKKVVRIITEDWKSYVIGINKIEHRLLRLKDIHRQRQTKKKMIKRKHN